MAIIEPSSESSTPESSTPEPSVHSSNPEKPYKPLWIALRLTHLSLESLNIQRRNINMMVSDKNRICALTDNLIQQGIQLGMPTSTAQLLYTNDDQSGDDDNGDSHGSDNHSSDNQNPFRIYERALDSEQKTLLKICNALYDITPHIEPYSVTNKNGCEDQGLLLEISRCIRLFKTVNNIFKKIQNSLNLMGISFRYAFGHTKHIAWVLSYSPHIINPPVPSENESTSTFISPLYDLSLDYVYEYPESIDNLKKTGFFTFHDIISHIEKHSLHSLRKRFGGGFCQFLSELLDIEQIAQGSLFKQPLPTYQPNKTFIESLQFDYPISNSEQLQHPVKTLLLHLTRELVKQQKQTQHIDWHLYDIHHHQDGFSVRVERLHSNIQLAEELTMIRLENQPLPFEVDVLELRCEHLVPVHFENRQTHNDQHYDTEQHALATVTAKLNTRLGENSVFTLAPKDSHIPELSYKRSVPIQSHPLSPSETTTKTLDRPSWIFNTPIKIGKRQNTLFWKGKLELLQGPERIEGLWWKKPTGRDYFIAKRDDHVRLWVFHDLYKDGWFVHGVFA